MKSRILGGVEAVRVFSVYIALAAFGTL